MQEGLYRCEDAAIAKQGETAVAVNISKPAVRTPLVTEEHERVLVAEYGYDEETIVKGKQILQQHIENGYTPVSRSRYEAIQQKLSPLSNEALNAKLAQYVIIEDITK